MIKPLQHKGYGSIPHCSKSKLGPSDKRCNEGQEKIATQQCRLGDRIIVQEKLDGSNCGVLKQKDKLITVTRSGNYCKESRFAQHRYFDIWVGMNYDRFDQILSEGERIVGEWLALCHGTKYELPHEPYVVFDIFDTNNKRFNYDYLKSKADQSNLIMPRVIHDNTSALSIDAAIESLSSSGHGALDPVEGCVWRVEHKSKVDFLIKYVRLDMEPGKYMQDEIWYWRPYD